MATTMGRLVDPVAEELTGLAKQVEPVQPGKASTVVVPATLAIPTVDPVVVVVPTLSEELGLVQPEVPVELARPHPLLVHVWFTLPVVVVVVARAELAEMDRMEDWP